MKAVEITSAEEHFTILCRWFALARASSVFHTIYWQSIVFKQRRKKKTWWQVWPSIFWFYAWMWSAQCIFYTLLLLRLAWRASSIWKRCVQVRIIAIVIIIMIENSHFQHIHTERNWFALLCRRKKAIKYLFQLFRKLFEFWKTLLLTSAYQPNKLYIIWI